MKLLWRVKLVAERHPDVVTETELACLELDEAVGLADLGLRLDEAKRLTAARACSLGDYAQALQAARLPAPRGGERWSRPSVARVLRYCSPVGRPLQSGLHPATPKP